MPPYSSPTNNSWMPSSSPHMRRTSSSGNSSRSSSVIRSESGSSRCANSLIDSSVNSSASRSRPVMQRTLPHGRASAIPELSASRCGELRCREARPSASVRRMSIAPTATRWVYDFDEGSRDMRELLGGKGANVAEMTRVLGADRVPAGFTITTEACVRYLHDGGAPPPELAEQVDAALARLERRAGRLLGDRDEPLLVSVRSGARDSMPGMLDTVLNLGLNDASVEGLALATGNERFAWDSYRRLVQMFGNVVRGLPGERFEDAIAAVKRARGVTLDAELDT